MTFIIFEKVYFYPKNYMIFVSCIKQDLDKYLVLGTFNFKYGFVYVC